MIKTKTQKFDIVWDKMFLPFILFYLYLILYRLTAYFTPEKMFMIHITGVLFVFLTYCLIDKWVCKIPEMHFRGALVAVISWPIVFMNIISAIITLLWWRENAIRIFEEEIKQK